MVVNQLALHRTRLALDGSISLTNNYMAKNKRKPIEPELSEAHAKYLDDLVYSYNCARDNRDYEQRRMDTLLDRMADFLLKHSKTKIKGFITEVKIPAHSVRYYKRKGSKYLKVAKG